MTKDIRLTQEELYRSARSDQISHIEWNRENIINWNKPLSVTLTTRFSNTPETQLRKEYSRFVNRLSKKIYPNTYKRYGKLIKETAYIEYGKVDQGIHTHMIVETPKKTDIQSFILLMEETWTLGRLESRRINVIDDSIHQYNSKFRTKKRPDTGHIVSESLVITTKYKNDSSRKTGDKEHRHHHVRSHLGQIKDKSIYRSDLYFKDLNKKK
jgi:hypothetical protein